MDYSDDLSEREIGESYFTPDEIRAIRQPIERASVPPLRIYSSKAYFEREVDAVLRPGWHALAHVSQLAETGAYVTANILNEPVLVVRDKDGIRAMSNVCRHRGARLMSDCGTAKALICPYHSWTYNLDGTLRGAPHMNKIDDFDRRAIRLPEFRVEIWKGFVFVNLDADAASIGPQVTGLAEAIASYRLEDWTVAPWQTVTADWNWKASLENFTEAYHHIGVHANSVGRTSKAEDAIYDPSNNNYSIFHVHAEPPKDLPPEYRDYPFPAQPGIEERPYNPVVNIYPTFHLVLAPNFVLWLRIDVRGMNDHDLVWHWLTPPGSTDFADYEERVKAIGGFFQPIIDEDLDILPKTKAAAQARAWQPGRYSDQELCVHQMHLWLLDRMERRDALAAPETIAER